jgi:hypothetical protein
MMLTGAACACLACGETPSSAPEIAMLVESQDRIVSEDGELGLDEGTLSIRSISLIGSTGDFALVGPVMIDLALQEQQVELRSDIPPGDYLGLRVELAPSSDGAQTLDVRVRSLVGEQSIRATSRFVMSGNTQFPEGARTISDSSVVALHVRLTGMFFYLSPLTDAVSGRFEAGEEHRSFLTMDLVNMFDLRVLP